MVGGSTLSSWEYMGVLPGVGLVSGRFGGGGGGGSSWNMGWS